MKSVQIEILEASRAEPQRENEDDIRYRARLAREVDSIDDGVWKGLSKQAQGWANLAVERLNSKTPVQDFPPSDDGKDDVEAVEELRKNAKTHLPGAKRRRGASRLYREILIDNLTMKKAEVLEELKSKGFELSKGTAEILYYETKMTLSVLAGLQDAVVIKMLEKLRK